MVSVAQWLEHWTVAPVCWGFESPHSPQQICASRNLRVSSNYSIDIADTLNLMSAPVAQLDRASASGAEGRRFESSQARFQTSGPLAQLVEQLTLNQRVAGSNPARLTIKKLGLLRT